MQNGSLRVPTWLARFVAKAQRHGVSTRLRSLAWNLGYDVRPVMGTLDGQRHYLLHHNSVNTCIDVGGADGLWALTQRRLGYSGQLVTIEPDARRWDELRKRVAADPMWSAHTVAVGARREHGALFLAGGRDGQPA